MCVLNVAGEKIRLVDYTWDELEKIDSKAGLKFLLPLGATEAHGYHLSLGADTLQAAGIAEMAAKRVAGVILMPELSYGSCVDTMNYCGTIHLSLETICSLVADIVESLYRHGFRKLVIYNGHGGNKAAAEAGLRRALCRLSGPGKLLLSDFNIYLSNAYEKISPLLTGMLEGKDYGHACEIETSVMLALAPEMVDMNKAVEEYMPGDSDTLWRVRDMKAASKSGVHGAPNHATVEKGEKILELLVGNLISLLKKI